MIEYMPLPANRTSIRKVLEHEFFDHRVIPQLEKYLVEQTTSRTYDFEANKALLKLYQFFPDLAKPDIVALMAGKALMNLPHPDFALLTYMAPEVYLCADPLLSLCRAADALESAHYSNFWSIVTGPELSPLISRLLDFEEQTRRVVLAALSSTFQTVSTAFLAESLGLKLESLPSYIVTHASKIVRIEGERSIFELNKGNQMQPKKFKENVEFDKVLKTVSSLGA